MVLLRKDYVQRHNKEPEEEREEKHVKEEEKRELKKRHEEKDANQEREKPRDAAKRRKRGGFTGTVKIFIKTT
tara:strand:+ start:110 stop:328 length:219 start_codon:yes stop_codon:yes gene_type:complete